MAEFQPIGLVVLLLVTSIIVWYLNVIVSLYRVRKTNGSFMLLLSQGICDLTGLVQYLWLAVEIIIDETAPIDNRWSSFMFYINWLTEYFHYICVGFCRADALIWPHGYSSRWNYRHCVILSICMWIVSTACDLLLSLLMTDNNNEYMIHNAQMYGIGPFADNSTNATTTVVDKLDVIFVSINYSAVGIASCIYLTAISASIYRRRSKKTISPASSTMATAKTISSRHKPPDRLSIEIRLTIVAVANFLPTFILTPIDYIWLPTTKYGYLAKTATEILNICVNAILLPFFSTIVRQNLLVGSKWKFLKL